MNPQAVKYTRTTNSAPAREKEQVISLETLLRQHLTKIEQAEKTIIKLYHVFMKTAQCEDIQDVFFASQQSSKLRIQRLQNILSRLGQDDDQKTSDGPIDHQLRRATLICEQPEGMLRDIQIINCALEGECHMVTSYKIAAEFCETLGQYKMGELLDTSLAEKENASQELTELLRSWLDKAYEAEHKH